METIYTWAIWNMKRDPVTGGVNEVFYRVRADKGEVQAISSGSVAFNPDPTSGSFVPYNELVVENVLDWVKSKLSTPDDSIGSIYKELDNRIAAKLDSKVVHGTF